MPKRAKDLDDVSEREATAAFLAHALPALDASVETLTPPHLHVASSPRSCLRITASSTLRTMSRRFANEAPAFPNIAMSGLPNALHISPRHVPATLNPPCFPRSSLIVSSPTVLP